MSSIQIFLDVCNFFNFATPFNQVDNRFIRISNIPAASSHAQLICREAVKKLWAFFGPWGRDRSQTPPC